MTSRGCRIRSITIPADRAPAGRYLYLHMQGEGIVGFMLTTVQYRINPALGDLERLRNKYVRLPNMAEGWKNAS